MSESRKSWIALNKVLGMTPETFYRLIDCFGDADSVWNSSEKELRQCTGIKSRKSQKEEDSDTLELELEVREKVDDDQHRVMTPAILEAILKLRETEDGAAEIERAKNLGADILILTDDEYPALLKEAPAPPPVLYVKGKLQADDRWTVAIVGTRKCTGYGRDFAFRLASALSGQGFTIVSGMASGIDTAGHLGALKSNGKTTAVFGTGIDEVFPSSNRNLADDICKSGAVISQFPIGGNIERWYFPMRNAVISGLSRGVVVVEAGEKSGAMITANIANEQGREVFAVPGDVNKHTTKGPHWLIKHGAHLVESAEDIMDILGTPKGQSELGLKEVPEKKDHAEVLDLLSEKPAQFDELCGLSGKPANEISTILMMLEMKGLVRRLPGGLYIKG